MAKDRSDEYRQARREADEAIRGYQYTKHFDDDAKLMYLERAVEAQRRATELERAFIESLEPCKACGRKVVTPCNDAEGYYEGGPWDDSCQYVFVK